MKTEEILRKDALMMTDTESQEDEIEALQSIFTEEEFHSLKEDNSIRGQFNAFVSVPDDYTLVYSRVESKNEGTSVDDNSGESEEIKVFEKTVNIQYLPPVQLSFNLPPDYPSKSPPFHTLSCPWLTFTQLKKLSRQLYKMWTENKGSVVLYSWAQFLKDDCLTFLKLDKILDVAAVERAYGKMFGNMRKREQNQTVSAAPQRKEDKFSVVDLSSVSDLVMKERAHLVKLSLYESDATGSNREREDVKSLDKANGPSEEVVLNEMIAFDERNDIKRSLYCSSSFGESNSAVKDAGKNIEVIPGPSRREQRRPENGRPKMRERRYRCERLQPNRRKPFQVEVSHLAGSLWDIIVDYNKLRKKKDFDYQMFCCAVCFEEKIGSQCMELENCNHVFCRECLTSYLSVCIREGKVKQLSCPETDCDTELLQSEIKSLVSPELFTKYDTLLLATTLDTLNVTFCPRKFCQYPVSPDNETRAVCPHCDYCFCPICKMVYHGVEPCRFKLDSEETKALIQEYQNCSEARKAELQKRYGRKHLEQLVDTSLSQSWISSNSKQCPNCNSSIERTYGCNKMVCLRCNTAFCWLCLEILNPYDPYSHFQPGSRCAGKLYLGMVLEDEDEMAVLEVEDDFGGDDDVFVEEDFLDDTDFEYFDQNVGMGRFPNGIIL